MHHPLRYRAHIDGLRAIAVLGVVLFHFGAGWLPGGFIGVDVFFVISGFLISKSIYAETTEGSFSIFGFYERRMRRIVPAFVVVSAVTAIVAVFLLFPPQLVGFARSLIWSALAFGNVYFYRRADYFGPSAEEMPLLHYWSLGVEEQFYLVFPALVMLCHRWRPRALPFVIGGLLVASLIACEAVLRVDPAAAFYLLPFRAFELLIGAALALPGVRFPKSAAVGGAAVAAGVGAVLAGMALITEQSPFPGVLALVPCLGTALAIWGGERSDSLVTRLVGSCVPRFFGAISYSLYLVHWPIVVFARPAFPEIDPLTFLVGGTAASTLLGWLCWRYVEQPVRQNRAIFPRRVVFGGTVAGAAVLIAFAGITTGARGFTGRLPADVQHVLAQTHYPFQPILRDGKCFLRDGRGGARELAPECLPAPGRPSIVLWGSSHLAQFYQAVAAAAKARGYSVGQFTGAACLPLEGFRNVPSPLCDGLNEFAMDWLLKHKPAMVVLGGDALVSPDHLARLDATIAKLTAAGIEVVVLGPVPMFKRPGPEIVAERMYRRDADMSAGHDMDDMVFTAEKLMTQHFAGHPNARFISVLKATCPQIQCPMMVDGEPLQYDARHFTAAGVDYYAKPLAALIFGDRPAGSPAAAAAP